MPDSPSLHESERAFLQLRVSRYGLLAGLIFGGFWLYRVVQIVFAGGPEGTPWASGYFDPSMRYHLFASLSLLAVWALSVRGALSHTAIRLVEALGIVLAAGGLNAMAMHLPLGGRPDYIMILGLTVALTIRAIYVPSTWQRSLVIAALVGLDLLVCTYLLYLEIDVVAWANIQPQLAEYTSREVAEATALNAMIWWSVITVMTTAASQVIYGLRRDAKEAKKLGQYQLERKLGEGGMGIVFKAQHALLRRPTAVKLLLPEKAGERSIERFEREVRLMARLRHPNTVTVFDYGRSPDGVFYYAMEFIDGATLSEVVDQTGPMEAPRALQVLAQAAAAMVEAHGIGLIHRDIKPANIMVFLPHTHGGIRESVKVLDFGLVKELEGGDDGITHANSITGTPQYISPEAIRDPDSVDGRGDVYALGCVMFYLLTGEHIFSGGTVMEVCASHLHEQPDTLSERLGKPIDPRLEALLADCLVKDPNARLASARELQRRLEEIDGLGVFTEHDAQEWWEEYGDVLIDEGAPAEQLMTMDLVRARAPNAV